MRETAQPCSNLTLLHLPSLADNTQETDLDGSDGTTRTTRVAGDEAETVLWSRIVSPCAGDDVNMGASTTATKGFQLPQTPLEHPEWESGDIGNPCSKVDDQNAPGTTGMDSALGSAYLSLAQHSIGRPASLASDIFDCMEIS